MEFWTYCKAVAVNWIDCYFYVTLLPEIPKVVGVFLSEERAVAVSAWFDRVLKVQALRRVYAFLILFGIFYSGYLAWYEQYQVAASRSPETISQNINEQNRTIGDLTAKIARLQLEQSKYLAQQWPTLTDTQIAEWSQTLSKYRITLLLVYYVDQHSEAFRDSLYEVFKRAGWPNPGALQAGITSELRF